MNARFIRCFALFVVSLVIAACATGTKTGGTKTITNQTWGHYQTYLGDIGPSNPGAFAVSEDGHYAFYVYCKDIRCASGTTYKHDAMRRCRDLSKQECYVFAFRRNIEVSYKVGE
jgi:hypothetical protein